VSRPSFDSRSACWPLSVSTWSGSAEQVAPGSPRSCRGACHCHDPPRWTLDVSSLSATSDAAYASKDAPVRIHTACCAGCLPLAGALPAAAGRSRSARQPQRARRGRIERPPIGLPFVCRPGGTNESVSSVAVLLLSARSADPPRRSLPGSSTCRPCRHPQGRGALPAVRLNKALDELIDAARLGQLPMA
jgi:hypothetical protein